MKIKQKMENKQADTNLSSTNPSTKKSKVKPKAGAKFKLTTLLACVLVLSLFALSACTGSGSAGSGSGTGSGSAGGSSATVSTNGSTSMEKVIGVLSEAFMQENAGTKITYDATGSGTGIEAAKNGSCDLGLSSRALKSTEVGLTSHTVALDGIALIVNSQSGVDNLTLEQVSDIFTGKITNWKEVGGSDLEISCIGREAGSGTRDGFESITKTADSCKLTQELTSTGAVITAVGASKNAIGYASLSSVEGQAGIKTVKVDGVECTEAAVLDGTYKIQRPFNIIVSDSTQLSSEAQAFLDFATSAQASSLIEKAGAIPVAK